MFKKLEKHSLGSPHQTRNSAALLKARKHKSEKKRYKWAKIFNPSIVQSERIPQMKYTCVELRKGQI